MAPSSTSTRRKAKTKPKKPSTIRSKKQPLKPKNGAEPSIMEDLSSISSIVTSSSSCSKIDTLESEGANSIPTSACSTPKAQKFRIPEIATCPPAPKKQRFVSNRLRRRPIAFFAPPDLEAFFFFAFRDISV
ncbi:hypothetical protein K2173_016446 [Erythroxylum novogranatense]|uniref:Uncharacterized protein n=1 Tax=Erythroxylum novogranatense TaxID=1862640 RepID=A0AAV8SGW0_9ROSI|nr:hypothetical protein K2173_016446 [Erythroxylum novogranatense]